MAFRVFMVLLILGGIAFLFYLKKNYPREINRQYPLSADFVDNQECAGVVRRALPKEKAIISAYGRTVEALIEVTTNYQQFKQGLQCRRSVPLGTGILIRPHSIPLGIWEPNMMNIYVPLDLLFLRERAWDQMGRGDVFITISSVKPCLREPSDMGLISFSNRCAKEFRDWSMKEVLFFPHAYVNYNTVLMLPAGWLASNGIAIENKWFALPQIKITWTCNRDAGVICPLW